MLKIFLLNYSYFAFAQSEKYVDKIRNLKTTAFENVRDLTMMTITWTFILDIL